MKDGHDKIQIAKLLNPHKSTISWNLSRNRVFKGYRPKQARATTTKRSENSRNAATIPSWLAQQAACLLKLQWSPEEIAAKLPVSQEALYQHVYADKARGGVIRKNIGQIPHQRPLSDLSSHIEDRKQVEQWECDSVVCANHYYDGRAQKRLRGHSLGGSQDSRAIVEGFQPFADSLKR